MMVFIECFTENLVLKSSKNIKCFITEKVIESIKTVCLIFRSFPIAESDGMKLYNFIHLMRYTFLNN